jgi:hypothetical protein
MSGQQPGSQPEPDPVEQVNDIASLRRESAARRVRLRETEQERDTLRERVDAQDRQSVEALVADRLADP